MTFKLAHISDLHLGYKATRLTTSQGVNVREADGYTALFTIVTELIENKVDALLVAGDTFHMATPDVRTVVFVQNQWRRLWRAGIPVYSLSGNHDTNDVAEDIAATRILHDADRKIYSHVEPYVMHTISPGINLHMVSHHMYSDQEETMKKVKPVPGELNIFTTHGSCIDPILQMKLHTEQSPREIVIPDELLKDRDWTYTLLGHIHERGYVGSKDGVKDTADQRIFYNGSLIRRGFADKECSLGRGWTLWEISPEGAFKSTFKQVAQRPQLDFPIINGKDKSTKEISEIIVERLRESQGDTGAEFDARIAPILRQRISNIEQSRYSALDWAAINNNNAHALQWQIKPMNIMVTPSKQIALDGQLPVIENGDVVSLYDDWVTNSNTLGKTDKSIHEDVKTQARAFVELGQEVTFDDDSK